MVITEGYSLRSKCKQQKTLTREENLELVHRIQAGDKEAEAEFLLRNGKLVDKIINTKFPLYKDDDDCFQQGLMGLLKAAQRFNFELGDFSVSTYAYAWIRQSIGRYISETEYAYRIPAYTYEKLRKVKSVKELYRPNSEYSLEEYVENKTGLDRKTVVHMLELSQPILSLDSTVKGTEGESDLCVGEVIEDTEANVENEVIENIRSEEIQKILKEILNERDFDIVARKFGFYGEEETLRGIGEVYNLSKERVRQIINKAIKKLRHPKYKNKLKDFLDD